MSSAVITIASQKGGVGKTTLARVLIPIMQGCGLRVAAVDADPNRGLADWLSLWRDGDKVTQHVEADDKALAKVPAELSATHDVVLMDTAGFGSRAMVVAIGSADGVLIPCMPDRGSVREAQQTAEWVANISTSARRHIAYKVVLVGFNPRRETDRFAKAQLTEELGLEVTEAFLSDRTGYQALTWSGEPPKSGPMYEEGQALAAELAAAGWIPAMKTVGQSASTGTFI